ncbi:MAG: D-alanine--D-alanine ligase [Flavobacteriaceae bacterium TMED238]|jgi:D-alanine-D-alanine ligase|nr:MAG: D-alanine--D-alanine ligase [Flavobacteriaceae bacterium TMED238]|tara:strand:- start:53 stop:967 length:915 start_codon:yes stop_codon:yes gene_type:complete
MKKRILVLCGGISKERLISLDTGKQVAKELKKNKYTVRTCEPDKNLFKNIKLFRPNIVFNALHGQFGEDGYIQAILETQKISYTHSGILASSIAMDKEISKKIFLKHKILTPKYIKFDFSKYKKSIIKEIDKRLKFPVVIKPINEGSSVHVYICTKKNIIKNLKKLKMYKQILIEEFIAGREIQVAVMGNKTLGAIELEPKRKFYDYEAKYNSKAKTKHIIPVNLNKKNLNKIQSIANKAHKIIGCRGVTRADFKYCNGKFYLLEVNTQPGMTKLSLVPEIAKHSGISFIKLIEWILKDASINR